MQIQYLITACTFQDVVICFKFSNFAYANTVGNFMKAINNMLLFALNLVTLLMQIQYHVLKVCQCQRCYLL